MKAGRRHDPRSVGAVVRTARAGLRAARALECALFFATAGLLARAAALLSGVEGGTWGVAILCGALAAASWWLEHPSPLARTARALDACLHHQGALALAFELEQRGAAPGLNALEELVRARVLARLRVGKAVWALLPSLFLPLAAPAVAGLLLLLVLDRRGAPAEEHSDLAALGAGLERALTAGLAAAPDLELGTRADLRLELQELRARLRAYAGLPGSSAEKTLTAGEARARLEALDRRLAELVARDAAAPRPRLEEARAWIDALRMVLPSASRKPGSMDAPSMAAGAAASAGAAGDRTGPGSLTDAPPDGTISRPMAQPATLPSPAPDAPSAPALGLQRGNFWPPEYDAVVERWVELSRVAQAGKAR